MVEIYDYRTAVKDRIIDYIKENDYDISGSEEELTDRMSDDTYMRDAVTGNDCGSYTCNSFLAAEWVYNPENVAILAEILSDYCMPLEDYKRALLNPEFADVLIRDYMYSQVLPEVAEFIVGGREE